MIPESVDLVAWSDFERHRREIRKPLTDRGRKIAAELLSTMTREDQVRCVEQSILGRWTGLFPLRQGQSAGGENQPAKSIPERFASMADRSWATA